jgi:predicted nuclease of predicted toxin-antitoxin system
VKFIIDAQLPKSLADFLQSKGYDAIHTIDLPDKNRTKDIQITEIATLEERVIISKDRDFLESFLLSGQPSKLIIVSTGNIRNNELISIFDHNIDTVSKLLWDNSLIEINQTELIVHA